MPTVEMNVLLPAVLVLLGTLVGALAPIVVGVLQSKAETRRERMRLATLLAIEDHKQAAERGREQNSRGTAVRYAPLSSYVAYHAEVLELVALGEAITPEQFIELRRRASDLFAALKDYEQQGWAKSAKPNDPV